MAYIYHLIRPATWEKALQRSHYQPDDYKEEGFIHFSTEDQVLGSASKHYQEEDTLVLLAVPEKRVKTHLKWEPSCKGKLFPHLYSRLALEWVETSYILSRNEQGEWEWER